MAGSLRAFWRVWRPAAMKGVARVPWDSNTAPRMCELTSGMMNSAGLADPGIDAFEDRSRDI